jgi:hypothetical protein
MKLLKSKSSNSKNNFTTTPLQKNIALRFVVWKMGKNHKTYNNKKLYGNKFLVKIID